MSTDSPTPSEARAHDNSGGFEFVTLGDDHEIEASYARRYVDRIQLQEGDSVRIQDTGVSV